MGVCTNVERKSYCYMYHTWSLNKATEFYPSHVHTYTQINVTVKCHNSYGQPTNTCMGAVNATYVYNVGEATGVLRTVYDEINSTGTSNA